MQAKQKLANEEADIMARIYIAKRQKGKGLVCHSCHMRMGKTVHLNNVIQCTAAEKKGCILPKILDQSK